MSKSKNSKYKSYWDNEDLDENFSPSKYKEERKNRRRQKRMRAALKTKNITQLMEYEDDF